VRGDLRNQASMFLAEGSLSKGPAMLIRGKMIEIQGQAASTAARNPILPASVPTLLLGGLLLLIGP
jgi:hypothetical protein